MLSWFLLLASAACFLSFGWALNGHFRTDGGMSLGMRLLSVFSALTYTGFIALLCASHPRAHSMVAVLFFLSSILLFWWTIASTRSRRLSLAHSDAGPHCLLDQGPYAFVRHPFYLSYLIFWTGTAVAAGHLQWLPVSVLIVWYVAIARQEERRLAASRFVASYRLYQSRTGMLFPKVRWAGGAL